MTAAVTPAADQPARDPDASSIHPPSSTDVPPINAGPASPSNRQQNDDVTDTPKPPAASPAPTTATKMVHSSICADLSVTEVSVTHSVAGKDFVREVKVEVAATERITRTVKPLSQAQQARRKPQQATKTRPETVVFRDIESDDVRTDEKPVPVDEDRDQERKLAKPEVQEKVVDAVVVVGESVVKRKDVKEVVVVEKTAVAIKAKTAKRKVFNDENKENMMPPRPQSANQPPEDEPKRRRTRGNGRRGRIPLADITHLSLNKDGSYRHAFNRGVR